MQTSRIKATTITLMTLFLLLTIASVGFGAEDIDGNRIYPGEVPGWQFDGPSPWFGATNSMDYTYNMSACSFNPYSSGPGTSHVVWTHQIMAGGATGGATGAKDWGFIPSGSFMTYGQGPIVCGGKVVYTYCPLIDAPEEGGQWLVCVDEETGELLWKTEVETNTNWINFYNHVAQYSGGLVVFGMTGSNLYIWDAQHGGLIKKWNFGATTGGLGQPKIVMEENVLYRRMNNVVYGWIMGSQGSQRESTVVMWQINNLGVPVLEWGPVDGHNINGLWGDYLLAWYPHTGIASGINRWTGQILWKASYQGFCRGPLGYGNWYHMAGDGYVYAISLATGNVVWRSSVQAGTGYWTEHGATVGNDVLINGNYDGGVYCFDAHTGELQWVNYEGPTPYEPYYSWYGTNSFGGAPPAMSGDGKVYIMPGDHMQHDPQVPGQYVKCFDVETGELIWKLPSFEMSHTHRMAIADGMLFLPNLYVNQIMAIGKGPTATEIMVDSTKISKGEYVWITGYVTDQSPAQQGTPAVAFESMDEWMAYLHVGMAAPATKTGVPVAIYAEDSDGAVFEVGTVTTDGDTGLFKYKWIPPAEDIYELTAVFMGDDSYWDSHGMTTVTVAGTTVSTTSLAATGSAALIAVLAIVFGREFLKRRKVKIE